MSDDQDKALQDMLAYGTGVMMDGKHVRLDQYLEAAGAEAMSKEPGQMAYEAKYGPVTEGRRAMTDIVERLRADTLPGDRQHQREARIELASLREEAATEIERLRAALKKIAAMDEICVTDFDGVKGWAHQRIARAALPKADDPLANAPSEGGGHG